MTSESEYRNAVRYLTNLLNGGLMGAKGTRPLNAAIEACELQIPKHLEKLVAESLPALQCGYGRRLRRRLLREPALRALSCLWSEARL